MPASGEANILPACLLKSVSSIELTMEAKVTRSVSSERTAERSFPLGSKFSSMRKPSSIGMKIFSYATGISGSKRAGYSGESRRRSSVTTLILAFSSRSRVWSVNSSVMPSCRPRFAASSL